MLIGITLADNGKKDALEYHIAIYSIDDDDGDDGDKC
jgi:hypothetical protein